MSTDSAGVLPGRPVERGTRARRFASVAPQNVVRTGQPSAENPKAGGGFPRDGVRTKGCVIKRTGRRGG
jgi:hypothetical protein